MANLQHHGVQGRTKEVKLLTARVRILGNTTPANGTFSVVDGDGMTIARTAAGKYRLTLVDKYLKLVGASFTVLAATSIDLVPQIIAEDVNGAVPYVDFVMLAGATATDTADGVTQDVLVTLCLKNTEAR